MPLGLEPNRLRDHYSSSDQISRTVRSDGPFSIADRSRLGVDNTDTSKRRRTDNYRDRLTGLCIQGRVVSSAATHIIRASVNSNRSRVDGGNARWSMTRISRKHHQLMMEATRPEQMSKVSRNSRLLIILKAHGRSWAVVST